jgi:hypothetical protein
MCRAHDYLARTPIRGVKTKLAVQVRHESDNRGGVSDAKHFKANDLRPATLTNMVGRARRQPSSGPHSSRQLPHNLGR